ncbi:MAG: isoprenylcysteine carboxylmethyltransferase family protein [Acidobacteriota bacterium]
MAVTGSEGWPIWLAYWSATLVMAVMCAALVYWISFHALIGFWRRLGARLTYGLVLVFAIAAVVLVMLYRDDLLAVHYGLHLPLAVAGVLVWSFNFWFWMAQRGELDYKTMLGLPEVSPRDHDRPLLVDGIYRRMRHPRYASAMLTVLAFALLTNYLAMWILVVMTVAGFWLVAVLEERELHRRYGTAYARYCAVVPRFLPRMGNPRPDVVVDE